MESSELSSPVKEKGKLDRFGGRYLLREFITTMIMLVVLLIAAGVFNWMNAWVFTGLALAYQIVNSLLLFKKNPALLNKRGKLIQETTKRYEKIFIVVYLALAYTLPLIAGFDAVRFQWSSMFVQLSVVGAIVFLLACLLGIWAIISNANFEMTVVTPTKEQQVCSSGPYKYIRHPGYIAEIVALLGTPLILGSWWSFIPSVALVVVFIVRTALEDKTLQEELPGYQEYTQKTRYRLIPFIW